MAYCAFADPGQVKKMRNMKLGAVGGMDIEEGMPRRAHKSWQYSRPIRRYDHYCKWLQNVISLLNHREFVIMVGGLLLIGVLGIMVDIWLAILIAEKGFFKFEIVVALHLGYSVALVCTLAFLLPCGKQLTACHLREGMQMYTHLMQPATAPFMNQSALLNWRLPPTTLLTSTKTANLQNADKESCRTPCRHSADLVSCAEEGWLDDDKSGAEDKGPSEDYTFFGVDLKPLLPVGLAVSTVIGGLCMLLVQIPMLSRFTTLSQVCVGLWHCLGVHGVLCLCWSWASQKDAKHETWCCWWHGHRGGDAAACAQVVAIFPSYPPLWSLL